MAAPHAQNHIHPYVSGWCEGTAHKRCKGSYAGTACSCACHRQVASTPEAAATATASGGTAR